MKKLLAGLMAVAIMFIAVPAFAITDETCARLVWAIVSNDGIEEMNSGTLVVSEAAYGAIDNMKDEDQLDLICFTLKGIKSADNEVATAVFTTIKEATEHAYLH